MIFRATAVPGLPMSGPDPLHGSPEMSAERSAVTAPVTRHGDAGSSAAAASAPRIDAVGVGVHDVTTASRDFVPAGQPPVDRQDVPGLVEPLLGEGVLHFVLYNRGHAGMCNILMSVQNALIIARLTRRAHIVFYSDRPVFNSQKKLSIFGLFDVDFPFSERPMSEYPSDLTLLPEFSKCCFYQGDQPHPSFANGRQVCDLDVLAALADIGTHAATLGYYSYLFHLKTQLRDVVVDFVKSAIRPKQAYLQEALGIRRAWGSYQSIHVRRGDYLAVAGTRNAAVAWDEMLPNIAGWLDPTVPVLVHTDETDQAYFQPMVDAGYTLHFFEQELRADLDAAEKGLVSLLVAAHGERFIGTMISTFTGIIQQYRRQHGDCSTFRYLYSQLPAVRLQSGEICQAHFGVHSWNRLALSADYKKTLFFFMEHPECYPYQGPAIDFALKVYPDFLSGAEADHLSALFATRPVDHDARQNRQRAILHIDQDDVLAQTVRRVMEITATGNHVPDNDVQMFAQDEGGETFLHSDSLAGEVGVKRGLSVLFYLNDDYDGGHLDFPYLKTRISPAKGLMLCFPIVNKYGEQVPDFSHSASVVTGGRKLMCYLTLRAGSVPGSS